MITAMFMCGSPARGRNLEQGFAFSSGASRARTGDPLLAKQVLSQLSYGPKCVVSSCFYAISRALEVSTLEEVCMLVCMFGHITAPPEAPPLRAQRVT